MQEKLTFSERLRTLKPGQIIWPLVIILVVLGIGVGIYNYQKNVVATKQPEVQIASVEDNAVTTDATIPLTGTVDKGTKIVINDKEVPVDEAGSFSANLNLVAGTNTITIVATGKNGKSTIVTRKVTREVPTPIVTTPTTNKAVAGKLAQSGPENFWIPEAALFAAAVVGWFMTKQRLALAERKQS